MDGRASGTRRFAPLLLAFLATGGATGMTGCRSEPPPSVVSAAPDTLDADDVVRTEPRPGRLGIRARVAYDDLESLAAAALPEQRDERGERRFCRRVLGLRLCGDARWDVSVRRTGDLVVTASAGDTLALTLPLRIDGVVGLDGRLAGALGLHSLDVRGAARATVHVALDLDERWCPRLTGTLEHAWTTPPELGWAAGIDIDLTDRLDELIRDELAGLPERLDDAIDCDAFRERLAVHWRGYRVPLSLPDAPNARLDIEPTGFGFTGVRTEATVLGAGFVLEATSVVHEGASAAGSLPTDAAAEPRPLPPLERVPYAPGRTSFEVLVRAGYERLDTLAAAALLGRTFRSETPTGTVAVDVLSVAFSGNPDGVTLALGFVADLPATGRPTRGVLYLTARPVVDPAAERISLEDIRLSPVLDSTLWSLVGTVFERQIVDVVRRRAVLELGDRTRELEVLIAERLSDPDRTGGLAVVARNVDVRLLSLASERLGLAAVARVDAEIDIDVPLAVLERPVRATSPDTDDR